MVELALGQAARHTTEAAPSFQLSQPWLAAAFTSAAVFLVTVFAMMFWRCDSTVRGLVKSFSAI